MQKRKEYLDGIKGILCILIMLGHYFGIYKYAVDAGAIENSLFLWLKNNSIISGYLLSYSNINRIVEIGLSVIKRFFRFALPMLGACACIYILYFIIGVHCAETRLYFDNPWRFRDM